MCGVGRIEMRNFSEAMSEALSVEICNHVWYHLALCNPTTSLIHSLYD